MRKNAATEEEAPRRPDLSGLVIQPDGRQKRFSATPAWVEAREHDKHSLIILWATWCAPCVEELPDLNDLQEKSADNLVVVGLLDELPTRSSKLILEKHLAPHGALRHNYYLGDASLKRTLFDPIAGERSALPAFILLAPDGRRLVEGRGTLTAADNARSFDKIRSIVRKADLHKDSKGISSKPRPASDRKMTEARRYLAACASDENWYVSPVNAVAAHYKKHNMSDHDLEDSLGSLVRILKDSSRQIKTRNASSKRRIVLWVDVTCETCERAARTARNAAGDLGDRTFTYEVVGFDPLAERAAAVLDIVRRRDPEEFNLAVEDFLTVLPHRTSSFTQLAESYVGMREIESLQRWDDALAAVRERALGLTDVSISVPFAEVDGFRLSRDERPPFGEAAFDPFEHESLFALAVRAIRACGGSHRGVK